MEKIAKIISDSIEVKQLILQNSSLLATTGQIASLMVSALKNGNRIYFCGNGGSAADASTWLQNSADVFIPTVKHFRQKHSIVILLISRLLQTTIVTM